MKTLANNLDELRNAGIPALYRKIEDYCDGFNDTEPDIRYHLGRDFNVDLGGPIMLVEAVEDLKQIQTTKVGPEGSYLSLFDTADCFDICEYFDKQKYVYVLLCTHNGGGITYIIPTEIANQASNVEKSIMLTNVDYSDPNERDDDVDYT